MSGISEKKAPVCSVVVPLYNEQEVINETYKRLTEVMEGLGITYELVFVNDGSKDATPDIARVICSKDKRVKFIDFARNFGHQTAITAGMDYTSGECVVVIDADLQDPPEVIPEMIAKWREGYEVVYGQRISREGETFFKKFTSKAFYRVLNKMTDVKIPVDTGDFRLIDRKVCDALKLVREKNRYVRGIVSWLGFKSCPVMFERKERFAGTTKYPLKKMLKLASDAIMSFSYKPLKIASWAGGFLTAGSLIYLIVALILLCCGVLSLAGQMFAILCISLFFSGITLISLGILGMYTGRIYEEAKDRPLYTIRDLVNFDEE